MNWLKHNIYNKVLNLIYPSNDVDVLLSRLNMSVPQHTSFFSIDIQGLNTVSGVSLSDYTDPRVRSLIHHLKYTGDDRVVKVVANTLQEYLLEYVTELLPFNQSSNILIIPIPLSVKRFRDRGFNQLHLVLDQVGKDSKDLDAYIHYDVLEKHQDTKPQTHLNRAERLVNIKGVFNVINIECVRNAYIILIDDVLTTGATVSEAAKILLKAGAARVDVMTIARAI